MSFPSRLVIFSLSASVLAVAAAVWVYAPFRDADYESAWWVLMWLAGSPVTITQPVASHTATAYLLASGALVFLCSVLSAAGSKQVGRDSIVAASVVGALWLSSPWHVAVLQVDGSRAYASMLLPALLASLTWWRRSEMTWLVSGAVLIAAVVAQMLIFQRLPIANLWFWVSPSPVAISPWVMPQAFSPAVELTLFWMCLHALLPVLKKLVSSLREARAPAIVLLLILALKNFLITSELVQVRANPRLALLYSLAYADKNLMMQWLELEHFAILGEEAGAADPRASKVSSPLDGVPESYRIAIACIAGETGTQSSSPQGPEAILIRGHLALNNRCAPSLPGASMPAAPAIEKTSRDVPN